MLNLIKGDSHDNYNIRIWYSPRNKKLEEFLLKKLIYKEKGEEIYEFTLQKKMLKNEECTYIINNLEIVPFKEKYIDDVCNMFDKSVSEEFLNLYNAGVFTCEELDEIRENGLKPLHNV